jgi:hypothetical protein
MILQQWRKQLAAYFSSWRAPATKDKTPRVRLKGGNLWYIVAKLLPPVKARSTIQHDSWFFQQDLMNE